MARVFRVLAGHDQQLESPAELAARLEKLAKELEKAGAVSEATEEATREALEEMGYAPSPEDEVAALVDEAIAATDAGGMQAMGKVMGILKPKLQGRADMGAVSGKIKARLSG